MGKQSRQRQQKGLAQHAAAVQAVARAAAWDPANPAGDAAPPRPWRELWRDHWVPVVVIAAVALAVRVAALVFIAHSPYREVSNIDSEAYERLAAEILKSGWLPSRHFYGSPAYQYFLAGVYKLFGQGTWAPRLVQILLGSAAAAVLYTIGAHLFTRRVGWLAGLGLALYGPLILEEVTVGKTALFVLVVLSSFAIFLRYSPTGRLLWITLSGWLLGASIVGVGQWLPGFFALGVFAAFVPLALSRKRRVLVSAVFLAAGLSALGPVAAWNSYKGGGLLLTSSDSGLNFYLGNNERATGFPARPPGLRDLPKFEEDDAARIAQRQLGRQVTPAEVSKYWGRQALDFIRRQPGAYLTLLWKKFQVLWNGYEMPDSYHYSFMRDHFVPVFYGCLTFGVVAPLALAGLTFAFWRRRTVLAMVVLCFLYLATLLLFYIRSRYRIPTVPFLLVFAAVAIERGIAWARSRDWRRLVWAGSGLMAAAAFVNQSYCEPPGPGHPETCLRGDTWYDQEWMKLAGWYYEKGDLDRTRSYLWLATETSVPRGPGQTWYWLGEVEQRKVEALLGQSAPAAAREHISGAETAYRRCVALRYRLNAVYFQWTMLYARAGLSDRVSATINEGLRAKALDRAALFRIARSQAQFRNCGGAEMVLAQADKDRGSYSNEAKAILAACVSR